MARANRALSTDKGLSNSTGAPRANHERVFGNRRLLGFAQAPSLALVTARRSVLLPLAQPLQFVSGWEPSSILCRSAHLITDSTGLVTPPLPTGITRLTFGGPDVLRT